MMVKMNTIYRTVFLLVLLTTFGSHTQPASAAGFSMGNHYVYNLEFRPAAKYLAKRFYRSAFKY